jgi:hypothetical protein
MAELLCVEGSSRVESDVPRAVTSAHSESKPHCCSSGRIPSCAPWNVVDVQ